MDQLNDAGLIILGTTNMTELGRGKGINPRNGHSAVGGQTQSPYIRGGFDLNDDSFGDTNPAGSNSGSAVGVAAGYAPISIGTEANGSIVSPASRASLYGLRPTPGCQSDDVIFSWSCVNSWGGLTKTVSDLVHITELCLQMQSPVRPFKVDMEMSWGDYRLGFLDASKIRLPEFMYTSTPEYCQQVDSQYEKVMKTLRGHGCRIHYPTDLIHPFKIEYDGDNVIDYIMFAEMDNNIKKFLAGTSSKMKSLADIIQWDKDHPEEQYGLKHDLLEQGLDPKRTPEKLAEAKAVAKDMAWTNGIEKAMKDHGMDFICSPTDGPISHISALAGCPSGTVPMGSLKSGRPYGLTFVARPFEETKLLEVFHLWEKTMPPWYLPDQLDQEDEVREA